MERPTCGLFLNTTKAHCSIYQSGRMVHDNIRHLDNLAVDYLELSEIDAEAFNRTGVLRRTDGTEVRPSADELNPFDFIVFNFHPATMAPYLEVQKVGALKARTFAVVLEIEPSNPYVHVVADQFDGLIVLDPTIEADGRAWPFPRPLNGVPRRPVARTGRRPVIGSFGLATPGKGFELVVSAVNLEFDEALVRINISPSTYADPIMMQSHRRPFGDYLGDLCKRIARPGIEVEITQDFMSEPDLLDWCEGNDLNCFMYTRRQSGLSATTDQAIIAGRPMLISANDTFRHIHPYILPYPRTTLRRALAESAAGVHRMQEDWSAEAFGETFRSMLRSTGVHARPSNAVVEIGARRTRQRVLMAVPERDVARTLLDWEERAVQALQKSALLHTSLVTFRSAAELRRAVFWSGCESLLMVQEAGVLDAGVEAALVALAQEGLRIRRACRGNDAGEAPEGWKTLGPIVPFHTMVQVLPEGRPVVNCYGFETSGLLAEVVGKVQREIGAADIRVHFWTEPSEDARAIRDRRMALLRMQLLLSPKTTVTLHRLPRESLPVASDMGAGTLNVFCWDTLARGLVGNLVDLAMAVDRVVCHVVGAPLPSYLGEIPIFEAQSLSGLLAEGTAGQAAAYNRFSEGRVLVALEGLLEGPEGSRPGPRVVDPALMSANPNGVLTAPVTDRLASASTAMRLDPATVDQRYRSRSLPQQGYLLCAVRALGDGGEAGRVLLIGNRGRQAAAALDAKGYEFAHLDRVPAEAEEGMQYRLVALLNALAGADELRRVLDFLEAALLPGGIGLLTFFFGEAYNVDAAGRNLDFPTLTRGELEAALRARQLETVTQPAWVSGRPDLVIDPFALPPFGTLTVQRARCV